MCGIAGTYLGVDQGAIETMLAKIMHRGPDGSGIQSTPHGILAHSRLAIIDPEKGQQPLECDGALITFNGEIYNFRELKAAYLPDVAHATHSDTETALRLFLAMGPQAITLFDGMFAMVILHQGQIFAARDPLGIKPLYYGEHRGAFHFASEIKALASICTTVQEFPAGNWFDSRAGWHCYYDVEKSILPYEGERSGLGGRIRSVMMESVRKRLLADVPVGVSLSGGLDSSIVTACAKPYLEHLHTFAVGMDGSSDLEAARLVSHTIGTIHHELVYSDAEMLAVLPEVIHSLETFDPALVRSAFPNWFLAKLASQEVKVMLTGEGADELYAGYDYLGGFRDPQALQHELIHITRNLHNTNLQRADRLSMAFGLEARVPFLDTASVAFALGLPAAWKVHSRRPPKQILRHAYRGHLPDSIVERPKLKFSQGAGSSAVFWEIANAEVSSRDFQMETKRLKRSYGYDLPNKEALYYYRILREVLDDPIIFSQMAPSRSL